MIQFPHNVKCMASNLLDTNCSTSATHEKDIQFCTIGFSYTAYSNRYDTNWGQGR
jgi:hypothetical protein